MREICHISFDWTCATERLVVLILVEADGFSNIHALFWSLGKRP